jgi:hypothetical protein
MALLLISLKVSADTFFFSSYRFNIVHKTVKLPRYIIQDILQFIMSPVRTKIDHQAITTCSVESEPAGFVVSSELPLDEMEVELSRLCESRADLHDESIEKCLFDHLHSGILLSSR